MGSFAAPERRQCRVCGASSLVDIISLGEHAISDFVPGGTAPVVAPLALVLCDPAAGGCALLQLKHRAVDPQLLYRNYWYKSGMNASMKAALADITAQALKLVELAPGDIVVDIGANDGTLLRSYPAAGAAPGVCLVGFEPADNLQPEAAQGTTRIINDFFEAAAFSAAFGSAKARIVTSIAMFYDLEDPNAFTADVAEILAPDGLWTIQMSYLPLMLETNNFDNICHEHVEYYSLASLEALLERHGLEAFDVELNDVNGGSFRIYVRLTGAPPEGREGSEARLAELRERERSMDLAGTAPYRAFAGRVEAVRIAVRSFVESAVARGDTIHVYGASTKGNTLLQYFGLDHRLIAGAAERNPAKWGLETVATGIPIISEEESRAAGPDYYLVLPWHFRHEFLEREQEYLDAGGAMLFPLPEPEIVRRENGRLVITPLKLAD